jgi:hypothetical protein
MLTGDCDRKRPVMWRHLAQPTLFRGVADEPHKEKAPAGEAGAAMPTLGWGGALGAQMDIVTKC